MKKRIAVGAAAIAAIVVILLVASAIVTASRSKDSDVTSADNSQPDAITAEAFMQLHPAPHGSSAVPIPEGPVFDDKGNLYVVSVFGDSKGNEVFKVDLANHSAQPIHGDPQTTPGGAAIGPDGRLYVADVGIASGRGRIISMRTDGSDVRVVVDALDGQPFFPDDIVFDKQGNMYFTDMQGNVVVGTGKIVRRSIDGEISIITGGLSSPNGIAFDPSGTLLWVSEHTANRLLTIDLDSNGQIANGRFPGSGITALANLSGGEIDSLTVDADGNVYAAMYKAGRVDVFDKEGDLLTTIRPAGGGAKFPNTSHVAIKPDTRDGYLTAGGPSGAEIFTFRALANGLHSQH